MFSRFFIDRPIFACVLSILITLAGGVAVFTLPIAQFPTVSPPTIVVNCVYPGASAQDVADAVAATIEERVNGVEGMLYMSSSCTNDGTYSLTVKFKSSVDLNMAQVLVQNRVALALPSLPDVIKQTGVTVRKQSPDILMGFAITSPDGSYDQLHLSNFAVMRVKEELLRLEGISDVNILGQRDYSMRIWVDPGKLAIRNLAATDVVRALREENVQVAAGHLGQPPVAGRQLLEVPFSTLGRLQEVEQFEQIIVKATPDGRMVRLRDVARVELGARNQDIICRFNEKEAAFLAIFQLPDANALELHGRVMAKMEELGKHFPEGIAYHVAFDTTPYTRDSIREVFKTLRDAIILVAAVVLLFLQNWRSALIPLAAVPVAVIGTFAAMAVFDFSLNNLTLFGLVLAIGIVVDDAIVVVEAVEHHIENGLSPREATMRAMDQVSGPVVAVGLVLGAVFIPCAFITGLTGVFFRQFALTIAVSTLISAFVSLTLSPALCALLLRVRNKRQQTPLPRISFVLVGCWLGWTWLGETLPGWLSAAGSSLPESTQPMLAGLLWAAPGIGLALGFVAGWVISQPLNWLLNGFFVGFNAAFVGMGYLYRRVVGLSLRVALLVLLFYGGMLVLTGQAFRTTPKGFIPGQDMGYLLVTVQLPDSASQQRTDDVMRQIEKITRPMPGIRRVTTISGQSFALSANGSNFGTVFINLEEFEDRRDESLSANAIANRLRKEFGEKIHDATLAVFPPPPVRGVGRAGGFTLMIEDRGDLGPQLLQQETERLVQAGNANPKMTGLFTVFRASVPQIRIEPSWSAANKKGVNLGDFASTLRIYEGSLYVNDFNRFGRTWQVIVQADSSYRDQIEDLNQLKVRNAQGNMVPISAVSKLREINGPLVLTRYNMYPAASITGTAAPGTSSRQAIDLMQEIADGNLPGAMAYEWTDMSYLELAAGNSAMVIFGFAVVMVFLVLAAQYESWTMPLAVILVVPMCLLFSILGVRVAGHDINVFTQIGFVVLVGLASKNAILIVEFARKQRQAGLSRREATLNACRDRLRPIIMTSLAFILGVVPLMLAEGAGSEMRRTLGTAVFAGMLGVTLFGLVLTPVFFFVLDWMSERKPFSLPWVRRWGGQSARLFGLVGVPWRLVRAYRNQPVPALGRGSILPTAKPSSSVPQPVEHK